MVQAALEMNKMDTSSESEDDSEVRGLPTWVMGFALKAVLLLILVLQSCSVWRLSRT